ncbi:MAG TPA: alpha/beta fold hydrolase [Longimicrobium sp.]|nr:alpha/beta fold hydrolase [Longimicrobium sp.]
MPRPVLLIPGTQATCLRDNDGTLIYNAVQVSLPLMPKKLGDYPKSQWVDLLSPVYTPGKVAPDATSRLPGVSIRPAEVLASPYAQPGSYERWGYDWRDDLRYNAARLLGELRLRAQRGDARAGLVGHSQGGLLIVLASKLAAPGVFEKLVSAVVLAGAPLAGTLRAAEALVFGSPSLGKEDQPLALAMARAWPALYQMLPAWPSVTDPSGTPLPPDQQLLSMGGWLAGWNAGVTQDMLDRARAVQALLRDPFAAMGGVSVCTLMGTDQETPTRLERSGNTFTRLVSEKKAGDTLVPYQVTMGWANSKAFNLTVTPCGTNTRPHAELCCDPTINARIAKLLA